MTSRSPASPAIPPVTVDPISGVATAALGGELDAADVPALRAALAAAVDSGPSALVVDLTGVTFVDGAVLGALAGARHRALGAGVRMVLVGAGGAVARALALSGVAALFGDDLRAGAFEPAA